MRKTASYKARSITYPRRLIRAIEIAKTLGKVPSVQKRAGLYNPLFIGLTLGSDELKRRITRRLDSRLRQGMVAEVKKLHNSGVSWKRLESFGLEYRAVVDFIQKMNGGENKNGKNEDRKGV